MRDTTAETAELLLHRAATAGNGGDLAQAERLCRTVLGAQPNNPAALHLLATIKYRAGDFGAALAAINRVAALQPRSSEAFFSQGTILHRMGRLAPALTSFDKALRFDPDHRGALFNRGIVLVAQRRLEEAVAGFDRLLALSPDHAEAHFARGCALFDLGRFADAIASYDRVVAVNPGHVMAWNNRANALNELGRHDEALESCERALAGAPGFAEAHANRGNVLLAMERPADAVASYDSALSLRAELPAALNNRGVALQDLRRFDDALSSFDRALRLIAKAAEKAPDSAGWLAASVRFNRASLLLLRGCFAEGWREYEWRSKQRHWPERRFKRPPWAGQELRGKRLFLYTETGLGAVIQFARFLRPLSQLAAEVTLEVPARLCRLLQRLDCRVNLLPAGDKPPDFDFCLPLVSAAFRLGFDPDRTPAEVPYLSADPELIADWRQRLPPGGFRVGIAWQGRADTPLDKGRSFPLRVLAPLALVPGVRLISLQAGVGTEQLSELPAGFAVATLADGFDSGPDGFLDAAAVMMNLDLIVTSDTSIAHLAGALGRPVWIALRHVPDWRWMLDRDDSPWYPTARLFRQTRPGNWDEVAGRIAAELRRLVDGARH
jgi:tetratricopeptide (TPR) repeat protein